MKKRNSRTAEVNQAMNYEERASYPDLTDAFRDTSGDEPHNMPDYTDLFRNYTRNDQEVIQ